MAGQRGASRRERWPYGWAALPLDPEDDEDDDSQGANKNGATK